MNAAYFFIPKIGCLLWDKNYSFNEFLSKLDSTLTP